jgi:hypothetical protein
MDLASARARTPGPQPGGLAPKARRRSPFDGVARVSLSSGEATWSDMFASPIERSRDPDARVALARVLRPFLLRRTAGGHA